MEDSDSTKHDDLRQSVEALSLFVTSQVKTERDFIDEDHFQALHLLAEGTGTCRFKVNEWSEPISLSDTDQMTRLLNILLILLWQSDKLIQLPYDPPDLRITRSLCSGEKVENQSTENSTTPVEDTIDNPDKTVSSTPFDENKVDYLLGPLDIDLKRVDDYHPLFSTFRKSTHLRKKQFLESKHILKARSLSGIDVCAFGYSFNLAVLQLTASTLEELNIGFLRDTKELELLRDLLMPKLRRLNVWVSNVVEDGSRPAFVFPPAPEKHAGLRWLRARLPRLALESLLLVNAKTLLELQLDVGTGCSDAGWPLSCQDLDTLLAQSGLSEEGSLRRLVLSRGSNKHTRASCMEQVRAVRQSLPKTLVECVLCRPG